MIYHFLNGPPILLRNNNVNKLRKTMTIYLVKFNLLYIYIVVIDSLRKSRSTGKQKKDNYDPSVIVSFF